MAEISDGEKQKIVAALEQRDAKKPCPRCGNQNFSLLGGYFNQPIQTQLSGLVIGGPSVPSVVVICSNCGFMAQHALGALGLLQSPGSPQPGNSDG
ncbi:MAG: hypothetical protein WCP72_11005 [Desulfomonile sp.]